MRPDRKIGEGLNAVAYEHKGRALKRYRTDYCPAYIMREAMVLSMLEPSGLPVPRLQNLSKIQDQWTLEMDLIEGRPAAFGMERHLEAFVDLQLRIHAVAVNDHMLLPNSKEICRLSIASHARLDAETKRKLLQLLRSLPDGCQLCHNDYHGLNVIDSGGGLSVIDWASATAGSPASDCCRTYAVTKIHHEAFAEPYLDLYCQKSGLSRDNILIWLPVTSAEWLNRNPGIQNPLFAQWLAIVNENSPVSGRDT